MSIAKKTSVVVPVYGYLDYADDAVATLLDCPNVTVVIVDDYSPDLETARGKAFVEKYRERDRVKLVLLDENRGLNFAWNTGIQTAIDTFQPSQICVTNSDVLFPPRWLEGVSQSLESGLSLVGPLTNAPGTELAQDITRYVPEYVPCDQIEAIRQLSETLIARQGTASQESPINGFCMVARTTTWLDNKFSADCFFAPRNEFTPRGLRNPTPLMTGNEYELQKRLADKGLKSGIALGSFVFHYRSVTRGARFGKGQTFRKSLPSF